MSQASVAGAKPVDRRRRPLVAHDRWFLEAVTNAVLELEAGRSTYFAGPWHNWRREKAARLAAATTAAQRIDVDIARLERFVERFRYKKSLAKRAQAKLTHIGRLEKERSELRGEIGLLTRRAKNLGFEFLRPARSGRTVVEAEGVDWPQATRALADVRSQSARRTWRSSAERIRQNDPPRDAPRAPSRRRQAAPRPRRRARVLLSTRSSSTRVEPCSR
jgi:hypothetical protein